MLTRYLQAVADLVWPRVCLACQAKLVPWEARSLCEGCWQALPRFQSPACFRCARPLALPHPIHPLGSAPHRGGQTPRDWPVCGPCLDVEPPYQWVIAAGRYEGQLKDGVVQWKFHRQAAWSLPLTQFLVEEGCRRMGAEACDLVLPVPLHATRKRERGFNQAALLAQAAARHLDVPMAGDVLVRTASTAAQSELPREERLKNVRRAFRVTRPRAVAHRRVLLVDDVFTTGATVTACAEALREAGAADVAVLVLARGTS